MIKKFDEFINENLSVDIYSDDFKSWFGDWENDPEHSSKVVDENGVPQVVTHLTHDDWDGEYYDTTDEEDAFIWGYIPNDTDEKFPAWTQARVEMKFYFNLKKPLIIDAEGHDSDDIQGTKWGLPYDHESALGVAILAKRKGYDGVIIKNVCDVTKNPNTDIIAFYPNQIKRIKGTLK